MSNENEAAMDEALFRVLGVQNNDNVTIAEPDTIPLDAASLAAMAYEVYDQVENTRNPITLNREDYPTGITLSGGGVGDLHTFNVNTTGATLSLRDQFAPFSIADMEDEIRRRRANIGTSVSLSNWARDEAIAPSPYDVVEVRPAYNHRRPEEPDNRPRRRDGSLR